MAPTRDADWWPRLDAAFQGALELPKGERAGYLDRVCGVDSGLRTEVDEMLAADGPEHALEIERLVHDAEGPWSDPDPFIGIRLGPSAASISSTSVRRPLSAPHTRSR